MNAKHSSSETQVTESRRTNIRHWSVAHNDWLRALKFYKDEIDILNDRLVEIASKNTGQEISRQIEHFQNQFVLHRDNIDELKHSIATNLAQVAEEAKNQDSFVSVRLLGLLEREEYLFHAEEKEINKLREEFNFFCAAWM